MQERFLDWAVIAINHGLLRHDEYLMTGDGIGFLNGLILEAVCSERKSWLTSLFFFATLRSPLSLILDFRCKGETVLYVVGCERVFAPRPSEA